MRQTRGQLKHAQAAKSTTARHHIGSLVRFAIPIQALPDETHLWTIFPCFLLVPVLSAHRRNSDVHADA